MIGKVISRFNTQGLAAFRDTISPELVPVSGGVVECEDWGKCIVAIRNEGRWCDI